MAAAAAASSAGRENGAEMNSSTGAPRPSARLMDGVKMLTRSA